MKIASNFKSRGTKNIELSSQETYNFQILGSFAVYKYAKIFKFATLDIKL